MDKQEFAAAYAAAKKNDMRKLSHEEVMECVRYLTEDPTRDLGIDGAENVVAFIKERMTLNDVPLNWFTAEGLEGEAKSEAEARARKIS